MIRFLIISVVILSLYLGFTILVAMDSGVSIAVYDYHIQTTFFTVMVFIILGTLILLIVLRTIFLVFELPRIIRRHLSEKKLQKINSSLLTAMSALIMGNKSKAREIANRVKADIKPVQEEVFNLILSEAEENFDQKIHYFRKLITSKDYGFFAAKRLAQFFFQHQIYEQAEDYALRAFNLNEFDVEILELMLHCYAKLGQWPKFTFITAKLARTDKQKLLEIAEEVAEYYLLAAKNTLEQGEDQGAVDYLESALELNPSYIDALDIYISLNLNMNHTVKNMEILKTAFLASPSFEIAEMYIKSSNNTPKEIYDELAIEVDPKKNMGLFLAIAAYLGLPEEIEGFKGPQLLRLE